MSMRITMAASACLALAVVVIFLLLAGNFQSLKLSFIVVSTIPAVIAGVAFIFCSCKSDYPSSSRAATSDPKSAPRQVKTAKVTEMPIGETVTVNGNAAGTVTYPHTEWENWQTVTDRVQLHKGTNTVTLTHATWYTELDAVDVC